METDSDRSVTHDGALQTGELSGQLSTGQRRERAVEVSGSKSSRWHKRAKVTRRASLRPGGVWPSCARPLLHHHSQSSRQQRERVRYRTDSRRRGSGGLIAGPWSVLSCHSHWTTQPPNIPLLRHRCVSENWPRVKHYRALKSVNHSCRPRPEKTSILPVTSLKFHLGLRSNLCYPRRSFQH